MGVRVKGAPPLRGRAPASYCLVTGLLLPQDRLVDDNCHGGKTPHLHDMEPLKNASGLAEFQSMKTFPPLEYWMQINTSSFEQEQPDLGRPVDEFSRIAMDCHLQKTSHHNLSRNELQIQSYVLVQDRCHLKTLIDFQISQGYLVFIWRIPIPNYNSTLYASRRQVVTLPLH